MNLKTIIRYCILIILCVGISLSIYSQTEVLLEKELVIGIKETPPFSFKDTKGEWTGISIELWEDIAEEMGLKYRYKELSLKDMLDGVANRSLDGAVGALTLTTEREMLFDFTHQFYSAALAIAVNARKGSTWKSLLRKFLSTDFLKIIGVLFGGLIFISWIIWLFERKKNIKEFGGGIKKGIGSGLWWSVVTMTAVGYGDKIPKTLGGRIFAIIWMFTGIILISTFIATMTSVLTVSQLEYTIKGPEDLRMNTVGTIQYTTSELYMQNSRIVYIAYPSVIEALKALDDGVINALVYDAPLLQYYINRDYKGKIEVLPRTFQSQDYGIALPQGSIIREQMNRILLRRIHEDEWQDLLYKYIGGHNNYNKN